MVLSRDASSKNYNSGLLREASEERIKATLDRLTTKEEDPSLMPSILNGKSILPSSNQISNQDILPFTDFGNKANWEATEGRNHNIAL